MRGARWRLAASDPVGRLLLQYVREQKPIEVKFRELVTDLRYGDRLTHYIHPYPGKLLPHIPRLFLSSELVSGGDGFVLDPFCGSGTVLLEAGRLGRKAIGVDANPLACLISSVKVTPIEIPLLKAAITRVVGKATRSKDRVSPPAVVNIDHWFHPHVTAALTRLLAQIQ